MTINQKGLDFYKKWLRDTKQSLFIATPGFFVFYLVIPFFTLESPWTFIFYSIYPALLIGVGFIYTPYFKRKYLNRLIKSIVVVGDELSVETFRWFLYKEIRVSCKITDLELRESDEERSFAECASWLLTCPNLEGRGVYLVREYWEEDSFNALMEIIRARAERKESAVNIG